MLLPTCTCLEHPNVSDTVPAGTGTSAVLLSATVPSTRETSGCSAEGWTVRVPQFLPYV